MTDRASTGRRLGQVATAAVAIVVAVASIGLSAGHIWARSAPDLALRFWPQSSEPMAQRAARLLTDPRATAQMRREADILARDALAHDPTNVAAIRTRGLLAALKGEDRSARQWMAQAEALSRRDFPTQLWLIEDSVARNDVDNALIHYDRALRTTRDAPDVLFPVLISASAEDPAIADRLARLVADRPAWWGSFMNRMIGESTSVATLDLFARRLRLSPDDPQHPDFLGRTLQRMADMGAFRRADALYRSVMRPHDPGPLRNGGFERDDGVLPFAWRLADEGDLGARIELRPDGRPGRALVIDAQGGRGGEVATQALAIAPGRYVLRGWAGATGADEEARPRLRLRCGSGNKAELAVLALPEAPAQGSAFSDVVTVPAGCEGLWLGIEARSGLGGQDGDVRPWIDDLSLTRDGRS